MALPIIGGIIKGIIGPVVGLVDDLHTSDEERLAIKVKLLEVQAELTGEILQYEAEVVKQAAETVRAEATGHSWMQRNWRPLVMLLFAYIVAHNYVISPVFGIEAVAIPPNMWTLLQIGLGGYVVGRSAEKIVPATIAALKAKEQ